ncbi:MFS transporter [Streptomyces asiaticus]|uniref:MFS transporter n=1 Tax=Streptomyces asiaticus TaxID=114695 RepID=UPI0038079364
MGKPRRRTALSDRIPGGRDGRRMLIVTFVDRIGSGLWGATATLYFTFAAGLSTAEIGLLLAVSGAIGIAGPPLGGLLADRVRLRPLLITVQLGRAAASLALLTTTDLRLLLAIASVGSLGDRAAAVLTKLYATRVAGPERVRYQAISRTAMNVGWAVGGLAAAAALTGGTVTVYRWLLIGDALSFVASALFTLGCAEPPSASRIAATSAPAEPGAPTSTGPTPTGPTPTGPTPTGPAPAEPASAPEKTTAPTPWRDRRYLAYTASEAVLFLDDSVFKVGLPLWAVTATSTPHQLVPLLLVLNNLLVVLFQVPFARFGATPHTARTSLWPLAGAFLVGGGALAASARRRALVRGHHAGAGRHRLHRRGDAARHDLLGAVRGPRPAHRTGRLPRRARPGPGRPAQCGSARGDGGDRGGPPRLARPRRRARRDVLRPAPPGTGPR